jgi:hypothetical protein
VKGVCRTRNWHFRPGCPQVVVVTDVTYPDMKRAIQEFVKEVNQPPYLKSGRVALVYFSGHGGKTTKEEQFLCPIEGRGWRPLGQREIKLHGDIIEPLRDYGCV